MAEPRDDHKDTAHLVLGDVPVTDAGLATVRAAYRYAAQVGPDYAVWPLMSEDIDPAGVTGADVEGLKR